MLTAPITYLHKSPRRNKISLSMCEASASTHSRQKAREKERERGEFELARFPNVSSTARIPGGLHPRARRGKVIIKPRLNYTTRHRAHSIREDTLQQTLVQGWSAPGARRLRIRPPFVRIKSGAGARVRPRACGCASWWKVVEVEVCRQSRLRGRIHAQPSAAGLAVLSRFFFFFVVDLLPPLLFFFFFGLFFCFFSPLYRSSCSACIGLFVARMFFLHGHVSALFTIPLQRNCNRGYTDRSSSRFERFDN